MAFARWLLLAGLLATAGGCCCASDFPGFSYDAGAYDRWKQLEQGLHTQPTEIEPNSGVSIQLPILFDPKSTNILNLRGRFEPGKTEPNVEGFATEGLQPPMVKLPGLKFDYEMFYPDPDPKAVGKKWPVYCYLGLLPPGQEEANKAKDEIKAAVVEKYAGVDWAPETLAGTTFAVAHMSIGGTQQFFPEKGEKAEDALGRFELYLVTTPHANVLVGFRAPQPIADALSLDRAAKASVASIKSEKPKPPAEATPPAGEGETPKP